MPAKAIIFGGGYLGSRMASHFGVQVSSVDVTDLQAVRAELDAVRPEVVINAAAKTHTASLERPENQDDGYRVNVQGAANVAVAAYERGIHAVHISTAMMFDGEGITEDSLPEPRSYYALTKALADAQLALFDNVLIARIHTPLSNQASPKNLLTKLQGFSKVADIPASLTVIEDFLTALDALIVQRATGIYNVVNPGSISMYRVATMMQKAGLIEASKVLTPLSRVDMDALTASSGGAFQPFPTLDTAKLQSARVILPSVEEAVARSINQYQV